MTSPHLQRPTSGTSFVGEGLDKEKEIPISTKDQLITMIIGLMTEVEARLPAGHMEQDIRSTVAHITVGIMRIAIEKRKRLEDMVNCVLEEPSLRASFINAINQMGVEGVRVAEEIRSKIQALRLTVSTVPQNRRGEMKMKDIKVLEEAIVMGIEVLGDHFPRSTNRGISRDIPYAKIRVLLKSSSSSSAEEIERIFREAGETIFSNAGQLANQRVGATVERLRALSQNLKSIQDKINAEGSYEVLQEADALRFRLFVLLIETILRLREETLKQMEPLLEHCNQSI